MMSPSLLTYITKPHFDRQAKETRPALVRQRSKSMSLDTPRPFEKSTDNLFTDHVLLRQPGTVDGSSQPHVDTLTQQQPILDTQSWERTLEKSIQSIVSIKASHVRSFDTETAGISTLSGDNACSTQHLVTNLSFLSLIIRFIHRHRLCR
jgi:hypothetical protein